MRIPWFHNRRQEILEQPFPPEWRAWLENSMAHYPLLTADEKTRIEGDLRIFAAEKSWEGALGLEVTDEIKVIVSALACLLTLGFEQHEYFPNVETIIVYPTAYRAPSVDAVIGWTPVFGTQDRLGEAIDNGPIIVSWEDVVNDALNIADGHNLVLHEFAHKLDFRYGSGDGVPRLQTQEQYDRWASVMSAEFNQLVHDTEHNHRSVLRAYGATNAAEFFAVATEAFFEKSVKLSETHPELYEVLRGFYRQDWAERMEMAKSDGF